MRCRPLLTGLILLAIAARASGEEAPRIVVSIAPLHSLVVAVTEGITDPHLVVPAGQSPHTFSLAPSDARALSRADVVFLAGGATDRFLERPLRSLAEAAVGQSLLDATGVTPLPARSGGAWRTGGHDHEGEHEHDHEEADAEHADARGIDPHAWLDPQNAIAFVRAVAGRLATLDPSRAGRYEANAKRTIIELEALGDALAETLAPVSGRPYLVFHDAYQYFERRYELSPVGSIVVDPGRPPGAKRLRELRDRITTTGAECLFVEPQFEPRIARSVAEGTGARIAELDPLGANLEPGPALYPTLLRQMAESIRDCLAGGTSTARVRQSSEIAAIMSGGGSG